MKNNTTVTTKCIEEHMLGNRNTEGDTNPMSPLLLKNYLQNECTHGQEWGLNRFIHLLSKNLTIVLFAIFLFSCGFVFAGAGDKVTVSGGATTAIGANGDYFYAGTTNVGGVNRDYYDHSTSSIYRIEYRYNSGYDVTEGEVWESTARGGGGTVRFYKASSSTTIPTGSWSVDVGSGAPYITFTAAAVASAVTTQAVSSIVATTATGNGNITSLGSPNPTAYGVCWNTGGTPTTSESKVDKGAASATGVFTASMTSLSPNTTYYVRAFATNTGGTSYGDEMDFTTLTAGT